MTYADRQAARDRDYTQAYRAWVESLPPSERARLAADGLNTPDASRHTSTRQGDELALTLAASPEPPPNATIDAVSENSPPSAATPGPTPNPDTITAADVLASFCARIRAHPNPLLAFDAACFASGLMDVEGLSQTELARRHGVTRAAFSKLVVQWTQTFGLPPSRGMRSKSARRAYRKARLTYLAQQDDRAAA